MEGKGEGCADHAAWLERLAITVSELLMLCACSPPNQNHQRQMQTRVRILPHATAPDPQPQMVDARSPDHASYQNHQMQTTARILPYLQQHLRALCRLLMVDAPGTPSRGR